MTNNFSIVIPCYNESGNLLKLIDICKKELCANGVEVILIDNGSTDGSDKILKTIKDSDQLLKSYRLEKNQGYGGGILYGLSKAKGQYIGWTHADLQTDPADVLNGFKLMDSDKIFVKGSRVGRPIADNIFSIGMGIFESIILRTKLWEINAQPTIFSKKFFLSWSDPPEDFSLDLYSYVMAKKNNLSIKRLTVFFPERFYGNSSWNTGLTSKLALIQRTIKFSFQLKKRISK
jgi:glycosyltransferase involved in cell wall biosynthesis